MAQLDEGHSITVEGLLNDRFVKLHCTVVRYCDDGSCDTKRFIQAGIMDITESVVLKDLLYGTSEALKRAAWAADEDTGSHVVRINRYAGKLAGQMDLDRVFIDDISNYAQLHDIGKINVAGIIRLPRKLNDEELAEMRKHTVYGAQMVAGLAGLSMAHDIALDHHEKWDGTGYPNGKKGGEISLAGRIVALADVFDALVSERPYKPAYSYEQALEIMVNGDERVRSGHFDPEIKRLFIDNYEEFVGLHREMAD
ncbi:MAG: HD domain-containing phosphohydrolase [Thermodesulfobacteriota bacterium]